MNENVCICNFTPEPLFEEENYVKGFVNISFLPPDTLPCLLTKHDLVIVVCDFDNPESSKNFWINLIPYKKKRMHLFCIGSQHTLRSVFIKLQLYDSTIKTYTFILKDSTYTPEIAASMVYNFITPFCSDEFKISPKAYISLTGHIDIDGTDNLSEEEAVSYITSSLKNVKGKVLLSFIGKNYSLKTTKTILEALPNCKIRISLDTTHNYNRILIIRPFGVCKCTVGDYKKLERCLNSELYLLLGQTGALSKLGMDYDADKLPIDEELSTIRAIDVLKCSDGSDN